MFVSVDTYFWISTRCLSDLMFVWLGVCLTRCLSDLMFVWLDVCPLLDVCLTRCLSAHRWLVFKKYVVLLNLIPVNKLWERKLRHWLTLINMTKSCQGKLSLQPISGVILSCTIIYQALIKPFSFFCILISSPRFIMINYELKINCILK